MPSPPPPATFRHVLCITDTHVPYLCRRSWQALEHYIAWRQQRASKIAPFDRFVHLGDLADWDSLNQHVAGKPRLLEGKRLKHDVDAANEFLDGLQQYIPDGDIIEGNHEYWVQRYLDANPALEGMVSVEDALKLSTRGLTYTKYWQNKDKNLLRIGKATFGHGLQSSAQHHASVAAKLYQTNFFYGHRHANQRFPNALIGKQKHVVAESIHCLCDVDRDWMMGNPSAWTNGFAEFTFRQDGTFWYNVVEIMRGAFVAPCGEYFTWRGRQTLAA